jgi:hypothetical protein
MLLKARREDGYNLYTYVFMYFYSFKYCLFNDADDNFCPTVLTDWMRVNRY